jgi:hypothetical protein
MHSTMMTNATKMGNRERERGERENERGERELAKRVSEERGEKVKS